MPHYRINYTIHGSTTLYVEPGETDKLGELIEELEDGCQAAWFERHLINGIKWEETEIEDIHTTDDDLSPDQELDFDTE